MDAIASCTWTASQICHYLPLLSATGTIDVDKIDIRNVDITRILRTRRIVYIEVALIQYNGMIGILDVNVLVGDVVDISVPHIWTRPSLQTRSILAIE
jgi:hypothetical protein